MKQMTRCKYHQQDIVSFCLNGNYGFMKLDVFSLCVLIVLPNIKHIISKHPLKCASLKYNNPSRQHKYNCLRCSFLLLNLNPPSMRLDLINYKYFMIKYKDKRPNCWQKYKNNLIKWLVAI